MLIGRRHRSLRLLSPLPKITASSSYHWWVYAAVSVATFITVAEQTATSMVVPRIAEEFSVDIPTSQWLAIGYMLCVSALMLPAGALANTLGKRNVWVIGLAIFILAALLTSIADNFMTVLVGKLLMAVGASAVQANGMAMVVAAFPDSVRGKAFGFHMTMVGLGAIGGPVLGGGIDSLLGWRAIFLVVAIVCVMATIAALLVFEKEVYRKGQLKKFDWSGVALSAAFLLSFMLSITYANELGWLSPMVILGGVFSILLLFGFLMWERQCESPMLPLHLFKSAIFSIGSAARFVSFMAGSASFFLLPFFLVSGVGMATAEAAIYILPGSICMAIFGPISGSISDRVGTKKPAIAGMILSTISMYLLTRVSLDSSYYIIAIASGMSGTGMSIFMAPNTSSIMWSAGRHHYGIVSAFMNLTRNGAHVVGIAIPTAIVVTVMGSLGYEADLSSLAVTDDYGLRSAYASAMSWAFTVSTVSMFAALVLTIVMPSVQHNVQEES